MGWSPRGRNRPFLMVIYCYLRVSFLTTLFLLSLALGVNAAHRVGFLHILPRECEETVINTAHFCTVLREAVLAFIFPISCFTVLPFNARPFA